MARSMVIETSRRARRLQTGRPRHRNEWLATCSMPCFIEHFLSRLSQQFSWECATRYFIGDLDLGVLGFDHTQKTTVARRSVGIPDCVAHLLSKIPRFIIGRRSLPLTHDLDAAMRSFKRQILTRHFFDDHGKTAGASDNFTLRWAGLTAPSTWEPPSTCPTLDETLTATHNDTRSKFAVAVTKDAKGNSLIPMRRDFKLEMTVALASDPTQFALQQPDRLGYSWLSITFVPDCDSRKGWPIFLRIKLHLRTGLCTTLSTHGNPTKLTNPLFALHQQRVLH